MFRGGWRHKSAWAGKLLGRFAARCVRREADGDAELSWDTLPDGHFVLPVREGKLVMSLVDARRGLWSLYMQWGDGLGDKFLAHASRGTIERLARHILRVGPPGGPDFRGQRTTWQQYDDETEHAVALGGGLRLMPPVEDDGDGVLMLAHNDPNGSVTVLGVGAHDELQHAAHEPATTPGARLRLSLGGRWRYLKALGAEGIVGYLDLGDDLFVLGHLGGDEFGLACQSGGVQRELRTYSLDEVLRGDLGSFQDWADTEAPRRTSSSPRSATQPPQRPRSDSARQHREEPRVRTQLQGRDLIDALSHLTPEDDITGPGAWTIPKILNGIRGLVQLAVGNKILWAAGILRLITKETGQQIHCCGKILNACLHWIARRTKLLVPHGKKWALQLGELRRPDSELLRWMIRRGPLDLALKHGQRRRTTAGRRDRRSQEPPGPATPEPAKLEPASARAEADPIARVTSLSADATLIASTTSAPSPIDTAPLPIEAAPPATPSSPPDEATPLASSSSSVPAAAAASPVVTLAADPSPSLSTPDASRGPFETFSCETSAAGYTSAASATGIMGTGSSVCDTASPDAPSRSRPTRATRWPIQQLLASMSYEELTERWVGEVERWQEQLGRHPELMLTATTGGLVESGAGSGGWVRRDPGPRKHRPP